METTIKLVSGLLAVPAVAALGTYFALRSVEQIFARLIAQAIEQAVSVALQFCECLVSQLDGFFTLTVLP